MALRGERARREGWWALTSQAVIRVLCEPYLRSDFSLIRFGVGHHENRKQGKGAGGRSTKKGGATVWSKNLQARKGLPQGPRQRSARHALTAATRHQPPTHTLPHVL